MMRKHVPIAARKPSTRPALSGEAKGRESNPLRALLSHYYKRLLMNAAPHCIFGTEPLAYNAKPCNLCTIVGALNRAHSVSINEFTSSDQATFGTRGCRFESCRARLTQNSPEFSDEFDR